MTSLERPVVPDVGIMTATSDGIDVVRPAAVRGRRRTTPATFASETIEARRDLGDEAVELGVGALRVHGHLDRADLHEREPREQVVGGVPRGHEHAVAGPMPSARSALAARSIRSSACP